MWKSILNAVIDDGPVMWTAIGLFALFFAVLFLRPSARWTVKATAAVALGALVGAGTIWLSDALFDVFKVPIPRFTWFWGALGTGALGLAVASFWGVPRWRKVVAVVAIPVFALVMGMGVNASFGLNKTLGSVLGISTEDPINIKPPDPSPSAAPTGPLYQRWTPPADMPAKGTTGTADIPATASGFTARPAGVYLPPAALTANPPRLPFVLLMMGQPGTPDPQYVAGILDTFAAAHQGLAPIVVVADQIGPGMDDTLCLDTAQYGKVQTYINTDVVAWARANLNILSERQYWTVAGYSNGGQCALSFAIKYPQLWGNLLDISGELFPGAENEAQNLATIFASSQSAYDAEKPLTILAGKKFAGTTAIFTAGSQDPQYAAVAAQVSDAARAAGMDVTLYLIPGAGHVGPALTDGLQKGFEVLYPRLGLAPPP
ncbi:alpha/beta hydrolase [Arthrobacter sp. 35W]|uniref:alpha/beta hydrolase n=1 Tax=Arthrobacter sp. 35W TaxID=1132441 RepID=UPI00041CC820|nr:alpha/beta hydrolase-fold protein [Arthrobacter sp. 35W]